jgi:leucyl-tRNA synthetase
MSEYNFREIEPKWQKEWARKKSFEVQIDSEKPKYYVLDMFPYPSGAGLHVGHPLGYIASDIVSRYKRMTGFNVLHPMGFDAFGLPAEQYAVQTGQHPSKTTERNISRYKEQLKQMGFSFDWSREVQTCDPDFYRWTQWIFLKLFDSWYDKKEDKAKSIKELIQHFEKQGSDNSQAFSENEIENFSSGDWLAFSPKEKEDCLQQFRLAFRSESIVNWCPELGTVLANEEIKDGFSERGGYPVEKKQMWQWSLRITAYADRLLKGLEVIDWPEPVKEMQRNWIGKSFGAEVQFPVDGKEGINIKVFTTRPDTIYGATFMVLAPEHEILENLTQKEHWTELKLYLAEVEKKSERERISEIGNVTGVFTGQMALNPFTNELIPIWVSDYVLAGYGTGAIMAVPGHDSRDHDFAKKFDLKIVQVVEGPGVNEEANESQEGKIINSDFLNSLESTEAIRKISGELEKRGIGKPTITYRLRDAVFGRQRYWGEPFPIFFKDDIPYPLSESELPLVLPEINEYKPTEDGNPPLGRAESWMKDDKYHYELSTMPGWAGSSWYWFRYMDPHNSGEFVSKNIADYWGQVDLYIGGAEHSTGHLLYSRFWTKFLKDLDLVGIDEPMKKLINQGMIQGRSNFVYRIKGADKLVSHGLKKNFDVMPLHVDIQHVKNDILNIPAFKKAYPEFSKAEFLLEEDQYLCGSEVEKMSKSKFNVVNPDEIIEEYGADTLRIYEMFLGPITDAKPWDTNGIEGVFRFLRKFWALFFQDGELSVSHEGPGNAELKILHKTLKKVKEDIERFSFNTAISSFMICTNELGKLGCSKKAILEPLVKALSPFSPHICSELWDRLGNTTDLNYQTFPVYNEEYLVEDSFEYPVMINGKLRTKIRFPDSTSEEDIRSQVLANQVIQKWANGNQPKKFIFVPKKIINLVI